MSPASTYLGGTGDEAAGQMLLNRDGEIIVSGSSSSLDFPIVGDSYDSTYNGNADVFISKFKSGLSDNQQPKKPVLSGPTSGKSGEPYEYTVVTDDAENNQIYYLFSWGDGADNDWLGPFDSGEPCKASHSWETRGDYELKVKAMDEYGLESEWSDPLAVRMPKEKIWCPISDRIHRLSDIFSFIFLLNRMLTEVD